MQRKQKFTIIDLKKNKDDFKKLTYRSIEKACFCSGR